MNLQGYIRPRTKGYKTSLTNSGCKLGEGFKLSQWCSSGRTFKRKSASNTKQWDWEMLHHLWHVGYVEVVTTDCSVQGSFCSQQGQLFCFPVPNPADQNKDGQGLNCSQLLTKSGAGAQWNQGESFIKTVYIRVQCIVYNPFLFWAYLSCIISVQPDNVCASQVI